MKTKLDTMNHPQRAAFGRELYNGKRLTINPVTRVCGWTITKGGK